MFRKLRAVIAVLLVICLVPVTPALADDNGGDIKLISQKKDNGFTGIADLKYERTDSVLFEKMKNALLAEVKIAGNSEKVSAGWRELSDKANFFSDMTILMELYCYQDSTDDNLLKEKEINASEFSKVSMMYCEAVSAVYDSEYSELVSNEFGDLTSRYVEFAKENTNPELLPIKEKREALISEYMKMMERSYTETEAADIFLRLINTNKELARVLGYDNYLDYAYKNSFSRDYGYEKTLEVLHGFRTTFMPFVNYGGAYYSDGMSDYVNEKLDRDSAVSLVAETAKKSSKEFEESMSYLQDMNLLEWIDSNSVTSYMDYLHYYKSPFIAMNKRNNPLDLVDVFSHEYGHFNNAYWHPEQYDTVFHDMSVIDYDVVEVPSTANEFIMLKSCGDFFGEYADAAAYNCIGSSIANTYYAACVAEVETVAYTEEFENAEELANRLDSVVAEYYGYETDIWSRYSHIFENPGYLISYVMAGLSSWEIASIYNEDPAKGIEAYNRVCDNVDKHYDDCMKASGLTYNWNDEKLSALGERIAEFYVDSVNPEFVGVENDAVYFGGLNVVISDATSVAALVRNGGSLDTYYGNEIYLPASDAGYTLLAADSFGNMSTVSFRVGAIPFVPSVFTEKGKQTISWNGVAGAESYKLYGSKTGTDFEFLASLTDDDAKVDENGVKTFSFVNKKVKSGTWKYYVKAYGKDENGDISAIAGSMKTYAAVFGNKTYTNAGSVEYKDEQITLAEGKSVKKTAKIVSINDAKKLANGSTIKKVRYYSSNDEVAKVNAKGRITAVSAGECFIYAVAANGEWDAVAVSVAK